MCRLYVFVSLYILVIFAKVKGIRLQNCECGLENNIVNRIVGGSETYPNQYPWLVNIRLSGRILCGGSIINDRYILTAGHCVRWTNITNVTVSVGQHDINKNEGVSIAAAKFILHDKFISHKYYDENDIALIELASPISFQPNVLPICLPKNDSKYYGRNGTVAGWGRLGENLRTANKLQETLVKVLTPEDCRRSRMGKYVTDTILCAYSPNSDACQGDSGGPLYFEKQPAQYEQIGIVSWGIGCATLNTPGIYTRLVKYLDWIYQNTRHAIYCKHY